MDKLRVSKNGHYLENSVTGEPFMWMGIVPWKLPELASREDIDYFITEIKKPEHRYNVILTVITMGRSCTTLNPRNVYGRRAFYGGDVPDFSRPRIISGGSPDNPSDFWDHLDYLVRACEENDIYLVLVPQWADTYINNRYNCSITPLDAPTARSYGEFLGDRYKNENHIIWMMGGDGGDPGLKGTKDIYRAQAEGILKGYTGCTSCPSWNQHNTLWDDILMTYHGNISKYTGTRVSELWDLSDEKWISIDGLYNATARRGDWYGIITDAYNLSTHKPAIEVEGQGFWDEYDPNWGPDFEGTKSFPYMHYLLGGAGPSNLDQHWNFDPGWEHNLDLPERKWVGYMTGFMNNIWYDLIPDNSLILSPVGTLWGEIVAARSNSDDMILVSFSEEGSGTAQLDLHSLSDYSTIQATWLNISNGSTQDAGVYAPDATPWFTVPGSWSGAVLRLDGISSDPCAGVDCPDICIGDDRWSQKCVDGVCVADELIESNSITCGYDPCAGVVCPDTCIGNDLWSVECVDGVCVADELIESNSTICGYDPCTGVDCPDICIDLDRWSQKCVDGVCVADKLIETNSITCGYDPCTGVDCPDICIDLDLWSQKCVDGVCVADQLIESNSTICGYDPCTGVDCPDICIDLDRWSQKCVDGVCVADKLIESNSTICGYDPCTGVDCPDICIDLDRWSQKCVDGVCVADKLIESNSTICGYDPCTGVDCPDICIDLDLWSQKCVDGICVADKLIKSNSITCGYDPCADPDICIDLDVYITPSTTQKVVLGGLGVMGFMMLMLQLKNSKK